MDIGVDSNILGLRVLQLQSGLGIRDLVISLSRGTPL